jgi:hypothetical protein
MEEILKTTNAVVNVAGSLIGLFDNIFDRIESVKKRQLSTENYLRAYYYEVITNIEILNCLNTKKLNTVSVNSVIFKNFITKLETQIGLSLLFTEEQERQSLYSFLKAKGRINNTNNKIVKYHNGKEIQETKKVIYENVLQAISFTVIKIEFLKHFSLLSDEELEMYNKIQIEKRLVNIKERLIMIKNVMDGLDSIKELAR